MFFCLGSCLHLLLAHRSALVSRRREKLPIDERLEGAAERVPSVDRGIEAGLAKLDGAYKSYRARRGSVCKRKVGVLIALSDKRAQTSPQAAHADGLAKGLL